MPDQTNDLEPEQNPAVANEPLYELTDFIARVRPLLKGRGHVCHPEERAVPESRGYGVGDTLIKVQNVLVENGRVVQTADVELELVMHDPEAVGAHDSVELR